MAAQVDDELRAEEAEFLGINIDDTRPFMQAGKCAMVNNMDVTLVARLLHHLGHTPEIVTSFPRSMRLASSAPYNGPTFILNTGDHYVTYALRKGTW